MQTLLSGRGLVESPRWHGDRLATDVEVPGAGWP